MVLLNPIIWIIILAIVTLVLSALLILKKFINKITEEKTRKKYLIGSILVVISGLLVWNIVDYISNKELYQMERELENEFDNVKDIEITSYGPNLNINIYVDKDKNEFEDIEPIFKVMMNKVLEKDNYEYLEKKQSKNTKELVFVSINFYDSHSVNATIIYRFNSYGDCMEWELDGDNLRKYNALDYKEK